MKNTWTRPAALLAHAFLLGLFVCTGVLLRQLPARGYGYGACTAVAPADLVVTSENKGRQLHFSWSPTAFDECSATAADHYRFQIRLNNSTLILSDDSVQNPQKNVLRSTLRRNHVYKFRVKAVAADGTTTEWSDYKLFRTTPKPPTNLAVRSVAAHQAYATWKNVARSKYIRYYQVVVYRKDKVVYRKKVRVGLHKHSTGVILRRLRSDAAYTLKVRAVANQTTSSKYAIKRFTQE